MYVCFNWWKLDHWSIKHHFMWAYPHPKIVVITHQTHALGVDQPVTVDSPEAHVLPSLDVDRLVDSGHIGEGWRFVKRRWGRGFQWTESHEVVHLGRHIVQAVFLGKASWNLPPKVVLGKLQGQLQCGRSSARFLHQSPSKSSQELVKEINKVEPRIEEKSCQSWAKNWGKCHLPSQHLHLDIAFLASIWCTLSHLQFNSSTVSRWFACYPNLKSTFKATIWLGVPLYADQFGSRMEPPIACKFTKL